jgi:hypothetical protein
MFPAKLIRTLCRLAAPTLPEASNWKPRLARKLTPSRSDDSKNPNVVSAFWRFREEESQKI